MKPILAKSRDRYLLTIRIIYLFREFGVRRRPHARTRYPTRQNLATARLLRRLATSDSSTLVQTPQSRMT